MSKPHSSVQARTSPLGQLLIPKVQARESELGKIESLRLRFPELSTAFLGQHPTPEQRIGARMQKFMESSKRLLDEERGA